VRIVAATNRTWQEAAAARFRLDLLYRLDVIRIAVPPPSIARKTSRCW
jgi:transcriptional regulator with PAS, ATPase and Fis domain